MIFKSLLSNVKLFHVLKLFSSLIIQLSGILLIFKLTPRELGVFTLILSIAQLLFTVTCAWNGGGFLVFGTKFFKNSGRYTIIVFYRLFIIIVSSFFLFVIVYFAKDNISNFVLGQTNLKLAILLFLGLFFYDFSSQLLYPSNKDKVQSGIELIYSIILISVTYFLVDSIYDYVMYFCAISGLFCLSIFTILMKSMPFFQNEINKSDFLKYLNYSKWQSLSVISIYVVNLGMNYVFVVSKLSLPEIGKYNLAYRLFMGFSPLFAIFIIQTPKWLNSIEIANKKKFLSNKIIQYMFLLVGLYTLAFLLLKPILDLLGKKVYIASIDIFFKLFPAFIFMAIGNMLNTILMNTNSFKKAQFGLIIQSLLLLTFSFIFVNQLGINGAILSTTLSLFGSMIFLLTLFKKDFNLK